MLPGLGMSGRSLDEDKQFLQLQLQAIFDNSYDALMLFDSEKKNIVRVNQRALEMFEMDESTLVGRKGIDLHKIYPSEQYLQKIRLDLLTAGSHQSEVLYKTGRGNEFWGSLSVRAINISGKKYQMIRITDITTSHQVNEKLKASLQEKEVLLAEIHHRVKNNLAVISGLLGLQSTYISDEQARKLFAESRDRIHSMALIHDKLYQHESFAQINFCVYINDLVHHIRSSYLSEEKNIEFLITCKDIFLDIKNAVPCGLILNELITNACKHAFPDRTEGEIRIVCTRMGEKFTMMVADNGIGFELEPALEKSDSLGLTLINALAGQLNGDVKTTCHDGTAFYLAFEV
jgi:PAS domain S-box-containing protein